MLILYLFFVTQGNGQILGAHNSENANKLEMQSPTESQRFQSHLQLQLNQISHPAPEQPHNNISKFQNVFTERDFDFVSSICSFLSLIVYGSTFGENESIIFLYILR